MPTHWFGNTIWIPFPLGMAVIIIAILAIILFIKAKYGKKSNKNTSACPNCGHRFRVKWYYIFTMMRCPKCREIDKYGR